MIRLAVLVTVTVVAFAAEVVPLAADADYAAGLDAYERALAADALDRRDDAGRLLRTARARLDAAIAGYRAALAVDPTRDEAQRRLTDAIAAGKPCCGRRSLWVEYGVE